MPKPIVNNRINYQNTYGRVIQHDVYLNQGVREGDSPTFANMTLTGNATIQGNLYVEGNTSMLDTNVVEFKDNIILVNNQENGDGVTLHQAGFEINRGSLETFRVVYNELTSRVEMGVISNLQPVALRESTPLENGMMTWNPTSKLVQATDQITIPISFTSTMNSTSSTSGAFVIAGGVGIKRDMFIDGKVYFTGSSLPNYTSIYTDPGTNSLIVTSVQDIYLTTNGKVLIPFNKQLAFGDQNQSISANSLTNNLSISSSGDINLTPTTGKKINIPNQIPLTFSTQNEKVYTDSSNNMVIAGGQDIYLFPNNGNAGGRKVFIPVDTPIAFGTLSQSILANNSNDLIVNANNNIFLNPGNALDIKVPTDAGLRFGSGHQRITADSNNDLFILSTGDLYLTPDNGSHIKVPTNVHMSFSDNNQYVSGDSNGNMIIGSQNALVVNSKLQVSNTETSTSGTTGSISTLGGLGVAKEIYCDSALIVKSDKPTALQINNGTDDILHVDNSGFGKISMFAGDGTKVNPALEISGYSLLNAQSLLQVKGAFDETDGYMIGRGTVTLNDGRTFTVNLPNYTEYNDTGSRSKFSITSNHCTTELFSIESETGNIATLGTLGMSSTSDSSSSTTGSLIVKGGMGVAKSIYTSGKIVNSVDSTTALQVQDGSSAAVFNIDTITQTLTINQKTKLNASVTDAFVITNNTDTLLSVDTVDNKLTTSLKIVNLNSTNSSDTSSGSIVLTGGAAIQQSLNVGGSSSFRSGINMVNSNITNLAEPSSAHDAATKAYVDLVKQGLYVKDSVHVATTQDEDLDTGFAAGNLVDNYILKLNDRILLKDQQNSVENGIYIITVDIPIRSVDLGLGASASGIFVFVKSGATNGALGWICNTQSSTDTVGDDPLNFTEFTGLGLVQAGAALTKNFNELNVNVDDQSIEVNLNALRIKSSAVSTGLTGGSGLPLQTAADQSHVTKLGAIDTGTWQGTNISVGYGGTGKTSINSGQILFGNGTNPVLTDANLYYDTDNTRLGLGTNAPTKDFEIKSNNTISFLMNADSEANNSTAKPEIIFSYNGGDNKGFIGMTRDYNQYANDIYTDAMVLSNDQTDSSSIIQLATSHVARITVLANGFVGINTSSPSSNLTIDGTMNVTETVQFLATKSSNSISNGSIYVSGGVAIGCLENSLDYTNGGALSVGGGASIGKDLYVAGSIFANSASASTFSYMTITATDEALNNTSGALVVFGGITIQCDTDASSVTDGGSLLTAGGVAIGKSLHIGSNVFANADTYLGNMHFTSSSITNYIQSPNVNRSVNSFLPIQFCQYNNTVENILTVANSGIVLNEQHSLQIGGSLNAIDGFTLQYITTGNLNVIPNSTISTYNINLGTVGSCTNVTLYGSNDGQVSWNSSTSNLSLEKSVIQLTNNSTSNINLTTPVNNSSFITANGANMTLNFGAGSSGGQLSTVLSNDTGNSSISFIPNNTCSSFILTDNVITEFDGPVKTNNTVEFSGNALHQTLNNETGSSVWYYFGELNFSESGYCEIDFNNGVNSVVNDICGLKITVAINGTTCIPAHSHYGNLVYNSTDKPVCYIFDDGFNGYNLFVKFAPYSQTNVNVSSQRNTRFVLLPEGASLVPDGTHSNFSNSWVQVYSTNTESTMKYTTGDLTVEGASFKVNDNLPIIGYNNKNTLASRDLGLLFQRFQVANDFGEGDIADEDAIPEFIDSVPNQNLIVVLDQIKFSSLASALDENYVGWWIKICSGPNTNQVRKIIHYNGAQRVATLETPFTSQNPNSGDTVSFYNNSYAVSYYDEVNDTFAIGYTHSVPSDGTIKSNNNAHLRVRGLYASDTTPSTTSSTGSLRLLGGISLDNTSDAVSATLGGTFTTAGGVAINKNLIVGNNIGIGRNGFTPQESVHIKKTSSTIRLENDQDSFSYIDFVESSTSSRFGIFVDSFSNELSLTNSSNFETPNNSNKALTINNLGYVGINATDIKSPLGINVNNFISTNSSTGFLGLIGGSSNFNGNSVGSRILLNANSNTVNAGCIGVYAGNVTSGNVSVYTNNDIERVRIDNRGCVTITSTQISDSNSTGSLITTGGVCVMSTQNATSITSGGALTVGGGLSVTKDLYIGGNIIIQGSFTASGAVTTPTIAFSSTTNCDNPDYFNNHLNVSGSLGTLTFGFTVSPTQSSENCEVEIVLPGRTNDFIRPFELISNVSGYTDDTSLTPLFNVIGCGVVGTPRMLVKFQSASLNTHYFQVQCTYILA